MLSAELREDPTTPAMTEEEFTCEGMKCTLESDEGVFAVRAAFKAINQAAEAMGDKARLSETTISADKDAVILYSRICERALKVAESTNPYYEEFKINSVFASDPSKVDLSVIQDLFVDNADYTKQGADAATALFLTKGAAAGEPGFFSRNWKWVVGGLSVGLLATGAIVYSKRRA